MKFMTAVLALAAVAIAAPADIDIRTGGGGGHNTPPPSTCSINGDNNGKITCCNSLIPILGQLLCNIAVLGSNCNNGQSTYCCNTSANGGLINVSLLNCLKL